MLILFPCIAECSACICKLSLLLDDANPAPHACHILACDKLVYVRPIQIVRGVNKTAVRRRWGWEQDRKDESKMRSFWNFLFSICLKRCNCTTDQIWHALIYDCQVSAMAWWGWTTVGLWVIGWLFDEGVVVCQEILFDSDFWSTKHKMACSFAAREIKINWCHGHPHPSEKEQRSEAIPKFIQAQRKPSKIIRIPASSLWGLWSSCKLVPCRSQCIMAFNYVPRWGSTEGRFFFWKTGLQGTRDFVLFSHFLLYILCSFVKINRFSSMAWSLNSPCWMIYDPFDPCGQLNHWNYPSLFGFDLIFSWSWILLNKPASPIEASDFFQQTWNYEASKTNWIDQSMFIRY